MKPVLLRLALLVVALCAPIAASAQWEKVPGFDGRFFDEVFFVDANHGWAAESFSPNIVYTTDGGRSWSVGQVPGAGSKMRDLCFVSQQLGFASGSDGLFKTTDGGRSWTDISPVAISTIPAIWFRNASEGVIALGACDGDEVLFMHTVDGGRSWTGQTYTVALDAAIGGVRYDNGTWYAAGGLGKVFVSDDGVDWTELNSGSGGWQEDIDVKGGTIFTASTTAGSCEDNGGGYLMVLPAGETLWTKSDPVQTYPFWGVSALSSTEAWACGDEGHVYHTTNAGARWDRYSCGFSTTDRLDDIDFVDANNGWAVGDGIFRYTGRVDVLPVTITPSLTICAGTPVRLEASGGMYYEWEPANGLGDPNVASPVVSPSVTTTYTVHVMSELGCTGTASVTVTVQPKPVAGVTQDAFTICAGASVQLGASGGTTYRWEPSTGLSNPNIANPIATPTATTRYHVIAMNGDCADTAIVDVTVGAAAAAVELPDVTADVRDDNVQIPIVSSSSVSMGSCDAESMTITLAFNGSLFFPRSVSRGAITSSTLVGGERRVTILLDRAALSAGGDVLTTITGNAMLGNAMQTPITVAAMTWNGAAITPTVTPGMLRLTGICMTGDGPRLLQPKGFGINKVAPNPSSGPTTVEIRSGETGTHLLEVYSLLGARVFETRWDADGAEQTRVIALPADMQSGTYEVVVRTGSRRDTETLFITK